MPKSGPYNEKNITLTRELKEMNFMFSWEHQYLNRSPERTISLFPLKHKIHVFSPAMPVIPGTD